MRFAGRPVSRSSAVRRFLALTILAAANGCAAVRAPASETGLRVEPSPPPSGRPALDREIILSPLAATQSAGSRRYVYVEAAAPGEVRMAATLFWEAPPPVLVEQALQRGLSARLGERVSAGPASRADAGRLSVTLDRFEERSGPAAEAFVSLRATLLDGRSRAVVLDRSYCGRSRIAGAAPSDRSIAFDAALNALMDRLASDLHEPGRSDVSGLAQC